MKIERDAVVAAIRSITDDHIVFTSPELAGEFTMTKVAERLGTTRRAVRGAFNTKSDAADGVRLKKMDEFFDRVNGADQDRRSTRQRRMNGDRRPRIEPVEPHVRFRAFCDQLTRYEIHHFFLDSELVFREFERRVIAAFTKILQDGIARRAFNVPNVLGAAQFAFDVLRVLAIEARSDDNEIEAVSFNHQGGNFASAYENHSELLLRSWGWNAGR